MNHYRTTLPTGVILHEFSLGSPVPWLELNISSTHITVYILNYKIINRPSELAKFYWNYREDLHHYYPTF